jgi:hypothetical protein
MGRGGSRCGAGRPGWRVKAEHCRRIDARRWQREGLFSGGSMGLWQWTDSETGERVASIGYRADGASMVLDYQLNGSPMIQRVPILKTPCHYGGWRSWFGCPRCGRRVALLYLRSGAGFVCRQCGHISYSSQSDDQIDRAWRRQSKAEAKLDEHWQRPKAMHHKTHSRIMAVILECEEQRDAALFAYMHRRFPKGFSM